MRQIYSLALRLVGCLAIASLIAAGLIGFSVAAHAGPNCKCTAGGKIYVEGQLACISLPSGNYTARCESVLNNTSWTKVLDGCPNASIEHLQSDWNKTQTDKS